MNMNITQFIHSFRRKHHSSKKLRVRELINPIREWFIGISLSFGLLVLIMAYAGYDFYNQYTGVDTHPLAETRLVSFKTKDIPPLIEAYRRREAEFNQIRESRPVVPIVLPPETDATTTPLAEEEVAQ